MRLKVHSVVCLIMLSFFGAARGFAAVVPQIVLGGGYDFVIIVTNKTGSARTADFLLLEGYDQPWSEPFSVNGEPHPGNIVRVALTAHSVQKLRLTGGEDLHVGYLSFRENFDSWDFVTPLATQFYYEFRRDGELIDSIGAPTGSATFGTNALAFPVERSHTVNTGLALAPWSPPGGSRKPFAYTLRLFDMDGNQVGLETFLFNGHEAYFFNEIFRNVPEEFLGWVSLEVLPALFEHLYVTVLRLEQTSSGFQMTNIRPDFSFPSRMP